MRYENYIIEPDVSCYSVKKIGIITKSKDEEKNGEEYIEWQKYPSDLVNALRLVRDEMIKTKIDSTFIEDLKADIEKIDEEFTCFIKKDVC